MERTEIMAKFRLRAWFRERVERGIADGVPVGRRPRESVRLGRRGRRGDFKPYV